MDFHLSTFYLFLWDLFTCFILVSSSGCPDLAPTNSQTVIGKKCYYTGLSERDEDEGVNWMTARQTCHGSSGELVVITNEDLNTKLYTGFNNLTGPDQYNTWIGLEKENDVWKWVNGESVDYANWDSNNPGSGDCAQLSLMSGKWTKQACNYRKWDLSYICQSGKGEDGLKTSGSEQLRHNLMLSVVLGVLLALVC